MPKLFTRILHICQNSFCKYKDKFVKRWTILLFNFSLEYLGAHTQKPFHFELGKSMLHRCKESTTLRIAAMRSWRLPASPIHRVDVSPHRRAESTTPRIWDMRRRHLRQTKPFISFTWVPVRYNTAMPEQGKLSQTKPYYSKTFTWVPGRYDRAPAGLLCQNRGNWAKPNHIIHRLYLSACPVWQGACRSAMPEQGKLSQTKPSTHHEYK